MELRLNINYEQLLNIIKQLPAPQIEKLKAELNKKGSQEQSKKASSDFQNFLLNGPVMSDEQYDAFVENRERMNQWRPK